jgi:hypothetical protein
MLKSLLVCTALVCLVMASSTHAEEGPPPSDQAKRVEFTRGLVPLSGIGVKAFPSVWQHPNSSEAAQRRPETNVHAVARGRLVHD